MRRHDLVVSERRGGATVFSANRRHPMADALTALTSPAVVRRPTASDDSTRQRLAALGAPVLVGQKTAASGAVEDTLVSGVALSHRDPAVARALPVAFYRQAADLNPARLAKLARERSEKAAVGFFLELTANLSGDKRFSTWARALRDRRVHARRPFFYTRSAALQAAAQPDRSPSVARRWGFRLDMALDDFRSLFEKAERAT